MLKQVKLLNFLRTATEEEVIRLAPKALGVVNYLLEELEKKPLLNAELNDKILEGAIYFADMDHYRKYLKPITECTYIAEEYGPCPVLTIKE